MEILIFKTEEEASLKAAELIKEQIFHKKDSVLGLATGSSPIKTYENLIKMYENKEVSFKDVITVNLDEYIGLSGDHPKSYRYFMNDTLFNKIDINIENTFVPSGVSTDNEKAAKEYEAKLDKLGGQDLQVLGVGTNGHIGFNEPKESLSYGTHVETLTESTINANKRFFKSIDEVPKNAISMGIGSIFKAKKIIVLAFGKAKADAIANMKSNFITTQCPVTLLKLHPNVTIILDEDAASKL